MKFYSYFLHFFHNIHYRCPQQFIGALRGCENQYSEIHTSHRDGKLISVCTLHTGLQIWVKFGVKGLHIMLLSKNEFSENRCRKNYTFLMGINAVTLNV